MKVFISADIEGVSGIVSWFQCGRADGEHPDFAFARQMMTHDVNAAIRGARAGGATDIVVKDSHGNSKNLLLGQLSSFHSNTARDVRLVSGHGGAKMDGMMVGIDETFDCAMLIGYHAMAGTLNGVLEHTITGRVHRLWINDMPAGEIGLSAGVAGSYGVPIVTVSSDAAGAAEAEKLLPGVSAAVVKRGEGRYMGECLPLSETGPAIEAAARKGMEQAMHQKPWRPEEPCAIRIEFNRSEEADYAARLLGVKRLDAYTVEYQGKNFMEAHQAAWSMFAMGGLGAKSDE